MCGIAGLMALDKTRQVDPELLDRMTDVLVHRGPDGRGTWIREGIGFGHRRLAIIDPRDGAQPWVDEQGRGVLTYNGELYNHVELRHDLEAKGERFRTSCDTEVVLKALIVYGVNEALDRFRGMFALGFYEPQDHRLTLARDPLGIKPLYWTLRDGLVRFGSEMKSILADPTFPRQVETTTLVNYLAHYRLSFRDRTLFKQIREVPAGSYLQWEGRRRNEKRYWSLPRIPEAEKVDRGAEATATEFREKLTAAVQRRLMADVPLGAYLSGGIDSTVLVHLMHQLGHPNLRTYSIGFPEEGGNEFEYSMLVAKELGIKHHQVTLTEEGYFKEFAPLIGLKDTPLSVPNEVPLRFLSRHLKHKITVVLSGEGADELLGGYTQLVRSPHDFLLSKALQEEGGAFSSDERARLESSLVNLYGTSRLDNQRDQFLALYQWVPGMQRQALFGDSAFLREAEREIRDDWEETWAELDNSGLDPYEKVLHVLELRHLPVLLQRLDATTMAEGVEGRVPFTDRDLVEYCSSLPLHYKIRWKGEAEAEQAAKMNALEVAGSLDLTKYLLRLTFAGEIPDAILMRPKTAFPVPVDAWFFGTRHEWARQHILTERMGSLFDLKETERLLGSARAVQEGMKIWMLANIGIWLDSYFS
ncbi:asparagine synthase (glutamine-hydrolyzing) [bacterium]|nr:asparagine synthase (glutamine-hydrolyzing) [bacterium]